MSLPKDKLTDEILALFEVRKMEAIASYRARGQAHKAETIDALKAKWIAQMTALADDTPGFDQQLTDDYEAELGMRGIKAPADELGDVLERLTARAKARAHSWTQHDLEMFDAKIERQLDANVRPSKSDKN
jgi:hypothetical protein